MQGTVRGEIIRSALTGEVQVNEGIKAIGASSTIILAAAARLVLLIMMLEMEALGTFSHTPSDLLNATTQQNEEV